MYGGVIYKHCAPNGAGPRTASPPRHPADEGEGLLINLEFLMVEVGFHVGIKIRIRIRIKIKMKIMMKNQNR